MIRGRIAVSTIAVLAVVIFIIIIGAIFLDILEMRDSSSTVTSTNTSQSSGQLNTTLTLSSPGSKGKFLVELSFPGILVASPDLSWMNYSADFVSFGKVPTNVSLSFVTPPELHGRFSPDTLSIGDNQSSAILQLASVPGTPVGTYQFTIIATADGSIFRANETVEVFKYLVVTVGTSFFPQNLTVSQGSTVTWLRLNGALGPSDSGDHDVDFSSGASVVSPTLLQYGSWNYTFDQAGNYSYYCKYHPFMTGKIIVVSTS